MLRVGLTGNVASGKSAVAAVWTRLGAVVISADALAREAVEPGTAALERIRSEFGESVLDGEGRLDRDWLRDVVFRDEAARRSLEAIVHPEVQRLRREAEAHATAAGAALVVHEIPLLFEVGLESEFDVVVLVDAAPEVRAERLVRDRGLGEAEAWRIIRSQMPAAAKRGRATLVIENEGTLDRLEEQAEAVLLELERRARDRAG